MDWLGDFTEDFAAVSCLFTTHDGTGAVVAPSSAFVAADFKIHKNGSATEKTTANGITVTSPFDSVTGLHSVVIDTSNDTGDAAFWTSGSLYTLVLTTAKTVAGIAVTKVLGQFGIELSGKRQTGDNFARLGAPAGASVSADVAAVKAVLPAALVSGRIDASVGAMAANVMTAAAAASDLTTELQAGLATASAVATLAGFVDTEVAAIKTKTDNLPADTAASFSAISTSIDDLPTNAELTTALAGADDAVLAQVALVKAKTDLIPTDPADASDIAASFVSLAISVDGLPTNAELTAALSDIPTNAELTTALSDIPTNAELTAALSTADDAVLTQVALVKAKTDLIPADPADASDIAALATSVDDLPTNAELTAALAGSDDAILVQVALVKAKTDALPTDPADQSIIISATDTVLTQVALVKAKTDLLTFTISGVLDANITYVNDVAVVGDGDATPWGPA